ncbi:MAG TPA: NDP-sugar synthase [Actinomycetota bacterium]|nr:NDP-sugar synthase [Actinomycetota bacterium]
MRSLILAGGFGTRLRPLTDRVPKSLLPICNRPFLEHQIRLLAEHGVMESTLLTGYLAEDFAPFAAQMRTLLGAELLVSTEEKPLGTAGAVRSRLDHLDGTTIVLNGDVLTDLDLSAAMAFHREKKAVVTIVLTPVDDARPYGLVPLDDDGRVQAFLEKPAELVAGDVNAGTYILEPDVLREVPEGEFWQFEQQLFPTLLERGAPVYGYSSRAYWLDIGTPERYLQAHFDVLTGRAHATVDGTILREPQTLADGTTIEPPVLLSHAPVGPGATLGPLLSIAAGAHIGARAHLERSVVHAGAEIGEGAVLRDTIVGRDARVEAGATLAGTVIA